MRSEIVKLDGTLRETRLDLAQTGYNLRAVIIEMARSQIRDEPPGLRASVSRALAQTKLAVTFRRSALRQRQAELLRQLEILAMSPLFDAAWYLKTYPDVAASKVNALIHYLEYGSKEGRHPSADFDAAWYLETYPDVAAAGMVPLLHYLEFGAIEGREFRPLSAKQEPDPATLLTKDGLVDGEQLWRAELLANSSFFDSAWYLEQYRDVAMEGINPVVHYLKHGASEGRNPGPNFDGGWYLRYHKDVAETGMNPLIHYLENGLKEKREIRAATDDRSVSVLLQKQFCDSTPLTAFSVPRANRRITIVADGLDMGTPYDGISTALILAAVLAKRADASIRLVTRKQPASAGSFGDILAANGIVWRNDVEFLYAPAGGSRPLAVSDKDTFLTTSWRTTRSVQNLVDPARIFCLLQEDERMSYPYGDERLRCEETMLNPAIRWVVSSELLFQHLTTGTEACDTIRRNGIWFEPAFPESTYYPEQEARPAGKKQVFFYASRGDKTNLYWRGLEVIANAIENGILRSEEWEFNLAGRDAERIFLPANAVVKTYANLCWLDYASLIRTMDLAVCLTGTGHSSYPTLDLAASGAVVVTNSAGTNGSPTLYSENIISANGSLEELGTALAAAARIAGDKEVKRANYSRNRLLRDWGVALDSVTEWITDLIGSQG